MPNTERFEEVTVTRKDGRKLTFRQDQGRDVHQGEDGGFPFTAPMRRADETTKKDAMEIRERIKKAGLL